MKLNKEQTKDYINLQLPIIKGELQQANNKIATFITFFGTIASISIAILVFLVTLIGDNSLYWIGVSLFGVISFCSIIKLMILFLKLKPKHMIKINKNSNSNKRKDVDLYFFMSYMELSLDEYLLHFTYDDQTKNALNQIYINSQLVITRYSSL